MKTRTTIQTLNLAAVGAALLGITACASASGVGEASTPNGSLRATLAWTSTGGRAGTMTAQLSNGESYSGQYFQITRETQVDELGPLWDGWGPGPGYGGPGFGFGFGRRGHWGGGWGYWGPRTDFVTSYSGRVVANLQGPNGTHMRCRFDLRHPSSGMSGGGQGGCQLPGGETIDAMFDKAT